MATAAPPNNAAAAAEKVTTSSAKQLKHLGDLTQAEGQSFLNSFDRIFCDCDGVIWQALREPISGAAEAIDLLRGLGKHVTFVTNNSISPIEQHLQKFERCGIAVEKCDVMHPAQTVCDYLKAIKFDGLIYCLATRPFKQLLLQAGFQLVPEKDRIISESVDDLRAAIYNTDPVKAVIIDVDFNLTVAKLMRAHVHLRDPECLFIGGAADVVVPFAGADVIGSGPFINVVEKSTKRNATILGKPGRALGEVLQQRYREQLPERVLFVGDSLTSDIQFGKMCGYQTLLVLSGGTKAQDLLGPLATSETPDYVANSLADFNTYAGSLIERN